MKAHINTSHCQLSTDIGELAAHHGRSQRDAAVHWQCSLAMDAAPLLYHSLRRPPPGQRSAKNQALAAHTSRRPRGAEEVRTEKAVVDEGSVHEGIRPTAIPGGRLGDDAGRGRVNGQTANKTLCETFRGEVKPIEVRSPDGDSDVGATVTSQPE